MKATIRKLTINGRCAGMVMKLVLKVFGWSRIRARNRSFHAGVVKAAKKSHHADFWFDAGNLLRQIVPKLVDAF